MNMKIGKDRAHGYRKKGRVREKAKDQICDHLAREGKRRVLSAGDLILDSFLLTIMTAVSDESQFYVLSFLSVFFDSGKRIEREREKKSMEHWEKGRERKKAANDQRQRQQNE